METETVAARPGTAVDAPGLYNNSEPPLPSSELGKDEFLQLLVAQLKYQDPLNPSSSEEFIATTAQFAVVEKLDELTKQGENSALVNSLTTASSLIGREVTANRNGVEVTAVVEQSQIVSGKVELVTKLGSIGLEQIVSVAAPSVPEPPVAVAPPAETTPASTEANGEPDDTAIDTGTETQTEAEPKADAEVIEDVGPAEQDGSSTEGADGATPAVDSTIEVDNNEPAGDAEVSDGLEVDAEADGQLSTRVDGGEVGAVSETPSPAPAAETVVEAVAEAANISEDDAVLEEAVLPTTVGLPDSETVSDDAAAEAPQSPTPEIAEVETAQPDVAQAETAESVDPARIPDAAQSETVESAALLPEAPESAPEPEAAAAQTEPADLAAEVEAAAPEQGPGDVTTGEDSSGTGGLPAVVSPPDNELSPDVEPTVETPAPAVATLPTVEQEPLVQLDAESEIASNAGSDPESASDEVADPFDPFQPVS